MMIATWRGNRSLGMSSSASAIKGRYTVRRGEGQSRLWLYVSLRVVAARHAEGAELPRRRARGRRFEPAVDRARAGGHRVTDREVRRVVRIGLSRVQPQRRVLAEQLIIHQRDHRPVVPPVFRQRAALDQRRGQMMPNVRAAGTVFDDDEASMAGI